MSFNCRLTAYSSERNDLKKKFDIMSLAKELGYKFFLKDHVYSEKGIEALNLENNKEDDNHNIRNSLTIKDPNSVNSLKRVLNLLSKSDYFPICIESTNKDILSFAANDSRILIIQSTESKYLKSIDAGIVSLCVQNNKFINFSLQDAIKSPNNNRSRVFREYSKFFNLFRNKEQVLIYGDNEKDIQFIRGPRELIAVLNAVFNIPLNKAKGFFYQNPSRLFKQIENHQDPNNIEQGIRIVKRVK